MLTQDLICDIMNLLNSTTTFSYWTFFEEMIALWGS